MLGVADRHAAEIRAVITDADATATDLDEVLDRVREAHRRGGNWVRLAGRTLAIALGNDAALAAARALGATHVQWLSRRDDRVRPTHVRADGQVRAIGDRFAVGEHRLRFPADPIDLPASWPEVAGCRCGLMIAPPDEARTAVMRTARKGTAAAAKRLVRQAAPTIPAPRVPQGDQASLVRLSEPIAAYRELSAPLDAVAGQWVGVGVPLVLTLAAPVVASGLLLTVVLPAGTLVAVEGASVALPAGAVLDLVSVTSAGAVAQPVA
jgi:hypothetical protein